MKTTTCLVKVPDLSVVLKDVIIPFPENMADMMELAGGEEDNVVTLAYQQWKVKGAAPTRKAKLAGKTDDEARQVMFEYRFTGKRQAGPRYTAAQAKKDLAGEVAALAQKGASGKDILALLNKQNLLED